MNSQSRFSDLEVDAQRFDDFCYRLLSISGWIAVGSDGIVRDWGRSWLEPRDLMLSFDIFGLMNRLTVAPSRVVTVFVGTRGGLFDGGAAPGGSVDSVGERRLISER